MPSLKQKATGFIQSKGFRKYFANTGWMMFNQVFNLGIAFFVGVYVARYLGPTNYGLLSFAQSVTGFLTVFASLGIKELMMRNLVRQPREYATMLGTGFALQVAASLLGIGLLYAVAPLLADDEITRMLLIILSFTTLFSSFDVIKPYFQSKVQAKKIVPVSVTQTIVSALVKLYLVYVNAELIWFAVVFVLDLLVAAVGLVLIYQRSGQKILNWHFDRAYARALLKDAWPLVLSGFVGVVYMRIDQVMIKYMLDDTQVGYYAVAVKFTSIWYFVGGIICSSLMPAVVQAKDKSQPLYLNRIQQLFELMIAIGIAIALPMTLIAYPLVNFLYGSEFAPAASVMIIHVWSLVFIFLGVASSKWLIVENLQIYNLNRTAMSAVVNVVLNYWLIPIYGIQGASFATLAAHITSSYLSYLMTQDTRMVFRMQSKALVFYSTIKLVQDRLST